MASLSGDSLLPAFASANIKILPYQIAAARFALRSTNLKGCILCDEGSLGKTYEALLVVSQQWYEGQEHILIILPQNLIAQWREKLDDEFTLPVVDWEKYTEESKGLCLLTYDDVKKQADKIASIHWDLAVFDEADALFKPESKDVQTIKKAVGNAFKLLLTPTPITNDIRDIYGLIHFIDETLLPDAETFYKRYFRKPENYPELSAWVSKFAFRTLKRQVEPYVNFTHRLPAVLNYSPKDVEKQLYDLTEKYLALENKAAYPQMDGYRLALQFYQRLSSSPQAFEQMLAEPIERASGDERIILQTMQKMAAEIFVSAKMTELQNALKTTFAHLKSRRETQKAIVFVDNLTTLAVLADLLKEQYSIIKHTDENALHLFRTDKDIQILITDDTTAKGLDIEYCPVVVNYDLIYNAVGMEQRICRCHRQGQNADVLVINLLSQENMSDVRVLELINKRTLQFQGIFGMSDDIVGNFDETLEAVLQKRRTLTDIQRNFEQNLETNRESNTQIVAQAESSLFTTFTKEVAEKVKVAPEYIQEQADFVNRDLWEVVKYYFENQETRYIIDDVNQTITLPDECEPYTLFYYGRGDRNVPYVGHRQYGMAKDFKPVGGRIKLTSILVKGILNELEGYEFGRIEAEGNVLPCELFMYAIYLKRHKQCVKRCDILFGLTKDETLMSQQECEKLLSLPIRSCETKGRNLPYWSKTYNSTRDRLPEVVEENIKKAYIEEQKQSFDAEVDVIKIRLARQKAKLEQAVNTDRAAVKQLKETLTNAPDRLEELRIKKQLNVVEKDLRKKEEGLFLEQMRLEVVAQNEIEELTGTNSLSLTIAPIFKVGF